MGHSAPLGQAGPGPSRGTSIQHALSAIEISIGDCEERPAKPINYPQTLEIDDDDAPTVGDTTRSSEKDAPLPGNAPKAPPGASNRRLKNKKSSSQLENYLNESGKDGGPVFNRLFEALDILKAMENFANK